MKTSLVFASGIVVGTSVASVIMTGRSAGADDRFAAERAELQQKVAHAEVAAQRSHAGWQATLLDLQALRNAPRAGEHPAAAPGLGDAARAPAAAAPAMTPSEVAMNHYLGQPVQAPADLPPAYQAETLMTAFKTLCEARGVMAPKLGVDASEFPFVVHGVLKSEGTFNARDFLQKIDTELRTLPGYAYGGSVTGRTKAGATYFALNMTPSSAYPREQVEAIRRRLMLRLQMTAAAWMDPSP